MTLAQWIGRLCPWPWAHLPPAGLARAGHGWSTRSRVLGLLLPLVIGLSGCGLPQISAEDRLFLPLAVELLDVYTLPPDVTWADQPVGGLSAIAYDRERDRLLALSDDRGEFSPAHFYTLTLDLDRTSPTAPRIRDVAVESATTLLTEAGQPFEWTDIDPEGLALSPGNTVFIASEGNAKAGVEPFIAEFDLESGAWVRSLPLPDRYQPGILTPEQAEAALAAAATVNPEAATVPTTTRAQPELKRGVQHNLGFESLTIQPVSLGGAMVEPFRLFAATESALEQDLDRSGTDPTIRDRFLHYLIGADQVSFISEYVYELDPDPLGTVVNGLSELLVIDQGGHFLALERSFGLQGFQAKLYQLATGGATDISNRIALTGDLSGLSPIQKRLVLDFQSLTTDSPLYLDNLEGMSLGPQLPDGSKSLLLISDNNFKSAQSTQLWLFKLTGL